MIHSVLDSICEILKIIYYEKYVTTREWPLILKPELMYVLLHTYFIFIYLIIY